MEFLADGGQRFTRKSGETMSRRARRTHTPAFKAKVALAAKKGELTPQLAGTLTHSISRSDAFSSAA